jgi:hypothetical protein
MTDNISAHFSTGWVNEVNFCPGWDSVLAAWGASGCPLQVMRHFLVASAKADMRLRRKPKSRRH